MADIVSNAQPMALMSVNLTRQSLFQFDDYYAYRATDYLPAFLQYILFWMIEGPLFQLYLFGPGNQNWGFWNGASPSFICQSITNVPYSHWVQHPHVCQSLILERFYALLILTYMTIYCVCVFLTIKRLCAARFCY